MEAVVAGHICLDVFPTLVGGAVVFKPGQTVEAGPVVFSTGGAVSNTGLALHKLGISIGLMGKVGSDLFGQAILQIVESHGSGLSDGMVVVPGESSSYSIIISPPNADRMLIHAPGCNATFGADDVRYNTLESVQLFHFGQADVSARLVARKPSLEFLPTTLNGFWIDAGDLRKKLISTYTEPIGLNSHIPTTLLLVHPTRASGSSANRMCLILLADEPLTLVDISL